MRCISIWIQGGVIKCVTLQVETCAFKVFQKHYSYKEIAIPKAQFTGEVGYFVPFFSDRGKNVFLVAKLLPAGVKGLVVCGILAALMSSLASIDGNR